MAAAAGTTTLFPVTSGSGFRLLMSLFFTALFITGNLRDIASVFGYHRLAEHRIVVVVAVIVVGVVMMVQIFGLFVTASG